MPRDGSSIYAIPPGTEGIPDTTIASAKYNGFAHDVETDLNLPRPIVAGGTGASNADEALFNLNGEKAAQLVTNFDAHVWMPGSFRAGVGATASPVAGQSFGGIVYLNEAFLSPPANAYVTVEARSLTDGKRYVRTKTAGTWGSWIEAPGIAADFVRKTGDTMSGPLNIQNTVLDAAIRLSQTTAGQPTYANFSSGTANFVVGAEGSSGGQLVAGGQPFFGVLNIGTPFGLHLGTNNIVRFTLGTNGAAQFTAAVNVATALTVGTSTPVGFPLTVRAVANENLLVTGHSALASGIALQSLNDAFNVFQPLEIAASQVRLGTTVNTPVAALGSFTAGAAAPRAAAYNGKHQLFFDFAVSAGSELIGMSTSTAGGTFLGFCNNTTGPLGAVNITGAGGGTGVLYTTVSDGNLKEDLRDLGARAGELIDALKVWDFKWKSSGERSLGVIAQEAQGVLPGAVSATPGADDTVIWGVDYSRFVPLLLEEVKRLRKRVVDLEVVVGAAGTILQRLDVLDKFREKIEAL